MVISVLVPVIGLGVGLWQDTAFHDKLPGLPSCGTVWSVTDTVNSASAHNVLHLRGYFSCSLLLPTATLVPRPEVGYETSQLLHGTIVHCRGRLRTHLRSFSQPLQRLNQQSWPTHCVNNVQPCSQNMNWDLNLRTRMAVRIRVCRQTVCVRRQELF